MANLDKFGAVCAMIKLSMVNGIAGIQVKQSETDLCESKESLLNPFCSEITILKCASWNPSIHQMAFQQPMLIFLTSKSLKDMEGKVVGENNLS